MVVGKALESSKGVSRHSWREPKCRKDQQGRGTGKETFAKSAFFRFGSDGKKKKKKTKKQISSKSLRLRCSKSPSRKNMRLADMLEQEVSKVGERDKLEATRGEVLAIQSGRRSKGSSPVIRHRNGLPEVELEHPLLMEEWQREYLYGF